MGSWMEQVKEQTAAAKKQAETTSNLEAILQKQHKLRSKKEKKDDVKFMIKLAKSNGDTSLYNKYIKKMSKLCSLSDSESEDESVGQALNFNTPGYGEKNCADAP